MRRVKWLLTLVLGLSFAASVQAGLYNSSEPLETVRGLDFKIYQGILSNLRNIQATKVEFDYPLRRRYLLQAELAAKFPPDKLTDEQKMNLGAIFIRRGMPNEAVNLLRPFSRQDTNQFLILSNLATAYQMVGDYQQGFDVLKQALDAWPEDWNKLDKGRRLFLGSMGFDQTSYDWNRKVETYQLKLFKLRQRERGKADFDHVDALFDDGKNPPSPIRFVADSGKFEPGQIAAAEKAKLPLDPRDAVDIVQQLLYWLPGDNRLYWLLGEVINAQGDSQNIVSARDIFEKLAGFPNGPLRSVGLVVEHRQVLNDFPIPPDRKNEEALANMVKKEVKKVEQADPLIDWRTLGVGFAAGMVVALFAGWQIREIRRRRQSRQTPVI